MTRTINRAAVLGSPIAHSLSPVLHNAAYRELGLTDWEYDRFAVGGHGEPDLETFLRTVDPSYRGFSVTMPLKDDALALSTWTSEHARDVGAANTLIRTPSGWVGESTDGEGVRGSLRMAGLTRISRAVLLGSGATSRSVIDALVRMGCEHITVAVRAGIRAQTIGQMHRLGVEYARISLSDVAQIIPEVEVAVSTLPTGTNPAFPPAAPGSLDHLVLMDCVYGGWPTPLAQWAEAGGARALSGLDMLIFQAAEQVRLMTGFEAPVEAMRAAVSQEAAFHTVRT
jgi:shikimate dehydrogenase